MYKRVGYFQQKKILRNSNFLDLTPLVQHRHEMEGGGTVRVLVPKFSGPLLGDFLQKRVKQPYMTLSLDEPGSATWLLCDGSRSVRQICQALKNQFGEKIHPVEDRVTSFLSQLYKKNLIVFREVIRDRPMDTPGGNYENDTTR
ncbi:MAG: PqqD family protein [Bacteroidales bacterium]